MGDAPATENGDGPGVDGGDDRDDGDHSTDDPLLAWALASFHAALFLLVPLTLAHAVAPVALGDLLGGLDTAVGITLYLVLWGSTWWSNRRYLAASDFDDARGTLRTGARWGAPTGLSLLLPVVLAALLVATPVFALLLLVVGGVVALLVGAAVGTVFAGVDLALDRLAGRLLG
jgi:hypothetical protein